MKHFKLFLVESDDGKLKHLTHPEDRIVTGKKGFNQAFKAIHSLHKTLQGRAKSSKLSVKLDGAPSLVFGTHPDTKKAFVATKSAFNKTPKINYTHDDIRRNHPDSPGLRAKLHMALATLPKVTPKKGVFQGDVMYTKSDVKRSGRKITIKPNTITYGTDEGSSHGKKMSKARLGIAVHTQYKGKNMTDMKAEPLHSLKSFGSHPHVHLVDTQANQTIDYPKKNQFRTQKWLGGAVAHHKKVDYSKIKGHEAHLQMYINRTVADNRLPTAGGYIQHLKNRNKPDVKPSHIQQAHDHSKHFEHLFKAHRYLELAKTSMIHALDPHNKQFSTSIEGKPSGHEGYVANGIDKIVKRRNDRLGPGFSQANFNAGAFRKK
jgi:hypothetical protein